MRLSSLSFNYVRNCFPALLLALLMTGVSLIAHGQSAGGGTSAPTSPAPQSVPVIVKPRSTPTIAAPATAQTPVAQPLQVITIVHRLSGWKLKTWLTFTNAKVLDPSLINQFVYTNIVAGYVLSDGRSVVARLPEADAEMLNLPAELGYVAPKNGEDASSIMLVRRDGARLAARFIGLDGSTWLTLLEADGLKLPPSRDVQEEGLAVGQPVRLFAPLRAQKTQAVAAGGGGSSSGGAVYMRVGEIKGTITNIMRASTGRVTRLTVRAEGLSPQIIGGVVLNEAGETVGLVEASDAGEARVMPASIVKRAAERILQRRASVPRPMLGVRGEPISATTLKQLETIGWKQEEAYKLLTRQEGVLLTMVAPKSPAALADLRAGDIIVRVNNGEVKNSEDFSFLLNEAGGGASVQFTVLRAMSAPREVTIKLSEALNLRRATEMSLTIPQAFSGTFAMGATPQSTIPERQTLEALATSAAKARTEAAAIAPVTPQALTPSSALIADLDYIILPADQSEPRRNSSTMLLVNVVRTGSNAEKLGLRAGDVVISVNGQKLSKNEWPEKFLLRNAADLSLVVIRGRERITLKYSDK